jgi:hypothetical protein
MKLLKIPRCILHQDFKATHRGPSLNLKANLQASVLMMVARVRSPKERRASPLKMTLKVRDLERLLLSFYPKDSR